MPDTILDLNLLVLAARAMEPAQKSPQATPSTLDERDTKDPAPKLLHDKPNERRRLDKKPKRQAVLTLSCCLSLPVVLPRSRCPLPVLPLSRAPSLSPVLSRFDSARTSLDKLKNKCERLDKNLVQKSARSLSLELPLALSPSRVLLLSCCLSHVRSLFRRRQASMAYGPGARERGGALLADWARRARGDCAPGAHGDRDGDDGTSSGGNYRCSSAFHSAAVCCLPPLSLSLPLSLVCPSCAPPSLSRVPLGMAWQGMANGEGQRRWRQAGRA